MIFRPHNVYGPRQNIGDRYRNVVGIFMNQILQGQPMTIFGDGTQTRAFSYIDDVAPVIARGDRAGAGAGTQVFNIGADQPYTLNELAGAVARAMGVDAAASSHLPAAPGGRTARTRPTRRFARVFGAAAPDAARGRARADGRVGEGARRAGAARRSKGSR